MNNITTTREKDQSLLQRQWAKSHKLTPLQLLDTLHHAIAAEERMLRFDYVSFHIRCLRLLRTLGTVLDNKWRQIFGCKYFEKETEVGLLVLHIFIAAETDGSILKQASEIVHELIEREGSVECERLKGVCLSSRVPKENCGEGVQ